MDLSEMRDAVGRKVKRPDLVADITDAINDAIEFASSDGDYYWDLIEGTENISSTDYAQNIVISTTFTRFRKIKYLKPLGYSRYLTKVSPDKVFTEQGRERVDCYYVAGDNIIFKLGVLQSSILYGYYQYPVALVEDADTNNYLTQMSGAIRDLATSYMFEQIGNAEEAVRYERKAMKKFLTHKRDKQDGVSYS